METKLAYTLPRIRISSSANRINSDLKGKQAWSKQNWVLIGPMSTATFTTLFTINIILLQQPHLKHHFLSDLVALHW